MDLNKRCYFLITGASKGIGKTMAIECCKKFKKESVVVLIARSKEGLESTKDEIVSANKGISVKTVPLDLSKACENTFKSIISESLSNINENNFELAFIIHNAASVGDVSKMAKEIADQTVWEDYFRLNLYSVAALNSVFMKTFSNTSKLVVNITSYCGIAPFKSMTLYCTGKASREMYFRCLAEEESDTVVLNYAPGPVETDMVAEVESKTVDESLRYYFQDVRKKKGILEPIQTTTKFLNVLEKFEFKSGDHVDYFD